MSADQPQKTGTIEINPLVELRELRCRTDAERSFSENRIKVLSQLLFDAETELARLRARPSAPPAGQ